MEARGFSSAPDSCASRVNPCDVWPFMKLPNGFGSHRYLYSPILLDSQELNNFSSTQPSCPHWCCQSCYYHTYHATLVADGEWKCVRPATISASWQLQVQLLLVTMVTGLLLMGNGDADWNNSGSCCGPSSWYIYSASWSGFSNGEWRSVCHLLPGWDAAPAPGYYGSWASASGNGEWRRMRCTCCQGCGSCTMFICQLGEGQWAMEPMDGATIPGKMYSKL